MEGLYNKSGVLSFWVGSGDILRIGMKYEYIYIYLENCISSIEIVASDYRMFCDLCFPLLEVVLVHTRLMEKSLIFNFGAGLGRYAFLLKVKSEITRRF